jgi:pimeloyl-ACP methyl ester carboxylesterase
MRDDAMPTLAGAEHRWADAGGVEIHVVELGREHRSTERPTLILVHGWPQNWWCWRDVMVELAARHHVVAVDLRGAGWSEVPAPNGENYDKRVIAGGLVALIEQLEIDRPVLVGHDWGGWISLLVAGMAPAAIRAVVAVAIVAPWSGLKWYDMWRFSYQLIAGGPTGVVAHRGLHQVFLRLVFRLGANRRFRMDPQALDVYLERYRDRARAEGGRAMYRRFLRNELSDTRSGDYAHVVREMPLRFLAGSSDMVLSPRLIQRSMAGSRGTMHVAKGCGHWIPEENPQFVIDEVEEFLADL